MEAHLYIYEQEKIYIFKFLLINHGEVENIIFNTRADFNVLKGFKTEYAIKKIFYIFFKKSMDSPLTPFFEKKHPNFSDKVASLMVTIS